MKPNSNLSRYIALLVVIIVPAVLIVAWVRNYSPEGSTSENAKMSQASSEAIPAPSPSEKGLKAEVTIDNFTFKPKVITVPKGATVHWTNRDDIPHVVASADGKFKKSPPLDTDQSFSHTFTEPGTYEYFCAIHPRMTGTVIVQ